MPDLSVKLEGWAEMRKALRGADPAVKRALGRANKAIAEIVAEAARASATSQGGVIAKTAPSIRALATQARAQVALGGTAYPFAMGAEFGSIAYKQFEPWRGSGADAGYALFPAMREKRPEVAERAVDILADELRKAVFG